MLTPAFSTKNRKSKAQAFTALSAHHHRALLERKKEKLRKQQKAPHIN